jgi:hypothetical protein
MFNQDGSLCDFILKGVKHMLDVVLMILLGACIVWIVEGIIF